MSSADFTINLKKYIKLFKRYEREDDPDIQDDIQAEMDELWYDLNDEEIAYIELNNLSI